MSCLTSCFHGLFPCCRPQTEEEIEKKNQKKAARKRKKLEKAQRKKIVKEEKKLQKQVQNLHHPSVPSHSPAEPDGDDELPRRVLSAPERVNSTESETPNPEKSEAFASTSGNVTSNEDAEEPSTSQASLPKVASVPAVLLSPKPDAVTQNSDSSSVISAYDLDDFSSQSEVLISENVDALTTQSNDMICDSEVFSQTPSVISGSENSENDDASEISESLQLINIAADAIVPNQNPNPVPNAVPDPEPTPIQAPEPIQIQELVSEPEDGEYPRVRTGTIDLPMSSHDSVTYEFQMRVYGVTGYSVTSNRVTLYKPPKWVYTHLPPTEDRSDDQLLFSHYLFNKWSNDKRPIKLHKYIEHKRDLHSNNMESRTPNPQTDDRFKTYPKFLNVSSRKYY